MTNERLANLALIPNRRVKAIVESQQQLLKQQQQQSHRLQQ